MLAGRYRLEDRLNAGPDGSLWHATDETLERQVSVRVLRPGHPFAADVVDAARRAALVDDPRLARVLDVGESDGKTYIVSEHVPGRALGDLLAVGPLPAETVRRIAGEAAQALERAGARGLHHLRLTPSSVIVQPDGSIKLVGTAVEAAVAGAEPDNAVAASRADAVGLVGIIYAGLTGRWPGTPGSPDGPLGPAPGVAGRAVPPGELVAGVPNDLDTLCSVALGPNEDGPNSPAELAEQLSPWAQPQPLTDPGGLSLSSPSRPIPVSAPAAAAAAAAAAPEQVDLRTPRPGRSTASVDTPPSISLPGSSTNPALGPVDAAATAAAAAAANGVAGNGSAAPGPALPAETTAPEWTTQWSSGRATAAQEPTVDWRPADRAPGFPPPPSPSRGVTPGGVPRVTDLEHGGQAWPTPAPAARATTVTPDPAQGGYAQHYNDLASEILGDPGARGVRRLEPAPAPHLGQASTTPWADQWGAFGGAAAQPGPGGPGPSEAQTPRQAQIVIAVLVALVVLGLILAGLGLRGLFGSGTTSTTLPSPSAAGAKASAKGSVKASGKASVVPPSSGSVAAGAKLQIVGVQAIDPQGDGNEHNSTASRAIDGDPATFWNSERYNSPTFAGTTKAGVGLVLDLGTPTKVTSVTLDERGTAGTVELRSSTTAGFDGSTVVAIATLDGTPLVITPTATPTTRYLVLWFTKVTQQPNGQNVVVVNEVSVR